MASRTLSADESIDECISALSEDINMKIKQLSDERHHAHYKDYLKVRNSMYREPGKEWDAQKTCRDFHLSYGHFRATYKDIFGISFHQDLIKSRIDMAKYLLLFTAISIPAISIKCGYSDEKYFMRQFRQLMREQHPDPLGFQIAQDAVVKHHAFDRPGRYRIWIVIFHSRRSPVADGR